jgi:hypothetical protein
MRWVECGTPLAWCQSRCGAGSRSWRLPAGEDPSRCLALARRRHRLVERCSLNRRIAALGWATRGPGICCFRACFRQRQWHQQECDGQRSWSAVLLDVEAGCMVCACIRPDSIGSRTLPLAFVAASRGMRWGCSRRGPKAHAQRRVASAGTLQMLPQGTRCALTHAPSDRGAIGAAAPPRTPAGRRHQKWVGVSAGSSAT